MNFQARVVSWFMQCFGLGAVDNKLERQHRFLEESLELVQALGCSKDEAHQLVDYVYGRPKGEPAQEVGGVMTTLAVLCFAYKIKMDDAGETELLRINQFEVTDKIRAKQAAKPKNSPLPQ